MNRTYVFDVPETPEYITFADRAFTHAGGTKQEPAGGSLVRGKVYSGDPPDRRLYFDYSSAGTYQALNIPWLSASFPFVRKLLTRPLTKIDITLDYWYGPRGKADLTFTGPLAAGKTFAADGGAKGTMAVCDYYGLTSDWGVRGEIVTKSRLRGDADVLVYDRAGKRRVATCIMTGAPAPAPGIIFTALHMEPEEIAAVTVNEEKRERTFHDVPVQIPGRAERTYGDELDAVVKRLNIKDPNRIAQLKYSGLQLLDLNKEAIKAIDLLRGADAWNAYSEAFVKLSNDRTGGAMSPEDLASVKRAVAIGMTAKDAQMRGLAIELGLVASGKEFIEPALSYLEGGDTSTWMGSALQAHVSELSPADIGRIEALVAKSPDYEGLVSCLVESSSPEASKALCELAASDKPWAWWKAMREKKTVAALGPVDAWPEALKVRRFIVYSRDRAVLSAQREAAAALLTSLVTRDFMAADPGLFAVMYDSMVDCSDRATAERLTASLLRTAKTYDGSVGDLVRQLNLWNGVNIAGLGLPRFNAQVDFAANWRQVARDAVEWLDTRKVRADVGEGYRVGPNDLRIVLRDSSDPEKGIIGIWRPPLPASAIGRVYAVESTSTCLSYSLVPDPQHFLPTKTIVIPSGAIPKPDYQVRYNIANVGQGICEWDSESFALSNMPVTFTVRDGQMKVVVERADSPKSILSGTKLFNDWWTAHGINQ